MKIGEILPGDGAKCLALKTKIDNDTVLTLGVDEVGFFSEYYKGENYVVGSRAKSYSRCYRGDTIPALLAKIPRKYISTVRTLWEELSVELDKVA